MGPSWSDLELGRRRGRVRLIWRRVTRGLGGGILEPTESFCCDEVYTSSACFTCFKRSLTKSMNLIGSILLLHIKSHSTTRCHLLTVTSEKSCMLDISSEKRRVSMLIRGILETIESSPAQQQLARQPRTGRLARVFCQQATTVTSCFESKTSRKHWL